MQEISYSMKWPFFQIALAAELTEAAQLSNYHFNTGDSPDESASSTPVNLSRGKSIIKDHIIFAKIPIKMPPRGINGYKCDDLI